LFTYNPKDLMAYRAMTFRTGRDNQLSSPEEGIRFVNDRGFILFWPCKQVVMPSLWNAVAGDRPVPDEHDDPGHITWDWKDKLLDKKVWYYARFLKQRNTMVSLESIPFFYALSANYDSPEEDILDQYNQGLLPLEAKLIFQALQDHGPLDTISLRREAHLVGPSSNNAYNRGLNLLQRDLKVLPTAISPSGPWRYAFVYDLTHRYFPQLAEQARPISEETAKCYLIQKYLDSVGSATSKEISSLFGWVPDSTKSYLEKNSDTKWFICKVENSQNKDSCYCSERFMQFVKK
jgi:hypothetical protein